jgi:hypothetical protein
MRRSLLALLAAAGAAAGGTALAQGGSDDPYSIPEPHVSSRAVLHLAADDRCLHDRRLLVRFTPPSGAVFGWFEVTVRGHRAARMTGVPRAASATVRLRRGVSVVRVVGETLGGQRIRAVRTYASCDAAPPPPSSGGGGGGGGPPIQVGGGED